MTPFLQFRGLAKRYGTVPALAGVTLDVPRGSILAVLGPNGAGKSTLFGCLLGLIRPTAGAVRWAGGPVGYLPERLTLYPQRTVWDNGLFFARLKHQAAGELEYQLGRVGLGGYRGRLVRQLSKGLLQRLGLAIALCGRPELLVLDEPFNGLDPVVLDDLEEILRAEHRRGATLLIATHTIAAVETLATHVAILLDGRLTVWDPLPALQERFPEEPSLEAIYHRVARQRCVERAVAVAA